MHSRANPSPRYRNLTEQYRAMHRDGEQRLKVAPEATFPGFSVFNVAGRIRDLIRETGAANLLDYGCGKGRQYAARDIALPDGTKHESLQDYWDVDFIERYDPCYEPFSKLPVGRYDGVISTDVLEHCPEEDMRWIIEEIFSFAERFVYANVACYPARKSLPSGENAHCTIKPPEWWAAIVHEIATRHPGKRWELQIVHEDGVTPGRLVTSTLHGARNGAS